jgi:hypothetical protein
MTVLAPPAAFVPSVALAALSFFTGDRNGDSGDRTLLGALLVLVVLGVVIGVGLFMGRADRA